MYTLSKGDRVRLKGSSQEGTVVEDASCELGEDFVKVIWDGEHYPKQAHVAFSMLEKIAKERVA